MTTTRHKHVPVDEMLAEDFMKPLRLTQTALAKAMGVERRLVNELCTGRRAAICWMQNTGTGARDKERGAWAELAGM